MRCSPVRRRVACRARLDAANVTSPGGLSLREVRCICVAAAIVIEEPRMNTANILAAAE